MDLNDAVLRAIKTEALELTRERQRNSSTVVLFSDCLRDVLNARGVDENSMWEIKQAIEAIPLAASVLAQRKTWRRVPNDRHHPPPLFPETDTPPDDWKLRQAGDKD